METANTNPKTEAFPPNGKRANAKAQSPPTPTAKALLVAATTALLSNSRPSVDRASTAR
jgi:hypothetical protein